MSDPIPVTPYISNTETELAVGKTLQLVCVLGEGYTEDDILWGLEGDGSIASVSDSGLVTGLKEGSIIVEAILGDIAATITLDIVEIIKDEFETAYKHIYEKLTDNTKLNSLVGGRVFRNSYPVDDSGEKEYPFILVQSQEDMTDIKFNGSKIYMEDTAFTIRCYAKGDGGQGQAQANALSSLVRLVLHGSSGDYDEGRVISMTRTRRFEMVDGDEEISGIGCNVSIYSMQIQ